MLHKFNMKRKIQEKNSAMYTYLLFTQVKLFKGDVFLLQ